MKTAQLFSTFFTKLLSLLRIAPKDNGYALVDESIPQAQLFPIRPEQIPYSRNFMGAFGKAELELTAWMITVYFRRKGGWVPAPFGELRSFITACDEQLQIIHRSIPKENHLGWLRVFYEDSDYLELINGKIYVTESFINRCAGIERSRAFRKSHPYTPTLSILHPEFTKNTDPGTSYDIVEQGKRMVSEAILKAELLEMRNPL